jgi:chorismate-pyruvate lyase
VQYGIVRIDLSVLEPETAARVRRGDVPLGRILIQSGVLCEVQRVSLLEVRPGPHLEPWLGRGRTYGRVAAIVVDGRPTIELLEISAAVSDA